MYYFDADSYCNDAIKNNDYSMNSTFRLNVLKSIFLYYYSDINTLNPYELPGKCRPVRVKIVTSGCYVKLDLIEFIQVVDDIDI